MYLKKGDNVVIISGKNKGKEGTIAKVITKNNKVVIENENMVTKHIKPQGGGEGGRVTVEAPIDASKVMLIDPSTKKPTRVGYEIKKDGTKVRVSKSSGKEI